MVLKFWISGDQAKQDRNVLTESFACFDDVIYFMIQYLP
jgi:hypothetical protein